MRRKPKAAWFLVLALSAPTWAQQSIGVSKSPDTKTHFVWTGADLKKNEGKTLYVVIQNCGSSYGTNVNGEIDVTFAKADAGQIKWCSYVGTDLDMKKCKPGQALKAGGEIKIK